VKLDSRITQQKKKKKQGKQKVICEGENNLGNKYCKYEAREFLSFTLRKYKALFLLLNM
jgi:hypothetical protein